MTELTPQEPPILKCPECGGEPTAESIAERNLSDMGYLHDDEPYRCKDCEHYWVHGIPIGENKTELAEGLWCPVCEQDGRETNMRVHRIEFQDDEHGIRGLRLHLKCPHCYYFDARNRDVESGQRTVLVGHPETTGNIEEARPDNTYMGDDI